MVFIDWIFLYLQCNLDEPRMKVKIRFYLEGIKNPRLFFVNSCLNEQCLSYTIQSYQSKVIDAVLLISSLHQKTLEYPWNSKCQINPLLHSDVLENNSMQIAKLNKY